MSEMYYGDAMLDAPAGSFFSPEGNMPSLDVSESRRSLPIAADSDVDARDKQILWHLVAKRLREARVGANDPESDEEADLWDACCLLEELLDAIITNPAPIRPPRD